MAKRVLIIIAVTLVVVGFVSISGALAAFYYLKLGPFASTEIIPSPAQHSSAQVATTEPLTDAGHYQTENNWIAVNIAQELTGLCWLAAHPNGPVPTFDIEAMVDPQKRLVHLEINGWIPGKPITADLTPAYAWDPVGYAALAHQLIGGQRNSEPTNTDTSDLLTDLLTPTGKVLAATDVALSGTLLQSPASATLHDKAALLLLTLALRENAGILTDSRRLLCRATAHLALAQALRSPDQPGWPGKVANTALLTLSGREVDALAQLDTFSAAPDATDTDKVWVRALRLANKDDWRLETLDSQSPLLMKIVWFQSIARNFDDSAATSRLDHLSPLEEVPDWGRALLGNNASTSVDIGHRFCESSMALEFKELSDVLATENNPVASGTALSKIFNEPIGNTVFVGPNGANHINVVGSGMFKDIALRQLFQTAYRMHFWLRDSWGVPDQDAKFVQQITNLFHDVPHEKYLSLLLHNRTADAEPSGAGLNEDVADIPPGFAFFLSWPGPAENRLCSYFVWGIPFNAPYAMDSRITLVASNRPFHGNLTVSPTTPPSYSDLRSLAPDSYLIASWIVLTKLDHGGHMTKDEEQALLSPFFDYNANSLAYFRSLSNKQTDFDDATLEQILRKQSALDPDEYFNLGDFLQTHGKIAEAADAYRNGVKQANDQVLVANNVRPLVEYDLAHGQQDEALRVAQHAAEVYSSIGIDTYVWLLCKLNRYDEAEDWIKKEQERYGGNLMSEFYAAHRDRYPDQYAAAEKTLFPDGLTQVTLVSFTNPPKNGCIFTTTSSVLENAGLQQGDVVVALDSYSVHSSDTYQFIRALSAEPVMDMIVWRNGKYLEVKPSVPNRRFGNNIGDYPTP